MEKEVLERFEELSVSCKCKTPQKNCQKCTHVNQQNSVPVKKEDIMEDDPEGYGSELSFLLTKVEINSQSNHTAVMSYIT